MKQTPLFMSSYTFCHRRRSPSTKKPWYRIEFMMVSHCVRSNSLCRFPLEKGGERKNGLIFLLCLSAWCLWVWHNKKLGVSIMCIGEWALLFHALALSGLLHVAARVEATVFYDMKRKGKNVCPSIDVSDVAPRLASKLPSSLAV